MSSYTLEDYHRLASEFAIRNPIVIKLLKNPITPAVEKKLLDQFHIKLIYPEELNFLCFQNLHLKKYTIEEITSALESRVTYPKNDDYDFTKEGERARKTKDIKKIDKINDLAASTLTKKEKNIQRYYYKKDSKECLVELKKRLDNLKKTKPKKDDLLYRLTTEPQINRIAKMIEAGTEALYQYNLYTKISIITSNPYRKFCLESETEALSRLHNLIAIDGRKRKRIMSGEIFKHYDMINFQGLRQKDVDAGKTLKTDTEIIENWIEPSKYLQLLPFPRTSTHN